MIGPCLQRAYCMRVLFQKYACTNTLRALMCACNTHAARLRLACCVLAARRLRAFFSARGMFAIFIREAPGPGDIHPEFLLHAGDAVTKRRCQYMSTCLERCKIPKIWRKTTVIALPKRNKPKDDPKSYRQISPLFIPFKLLERMIHGRINPIIDP